MTISEIFLIILSVLYCMTWFGWLRYWRHTEDTIDEFCRQESKYYDEILGLKLLVKATIDNMMNDETWHRCTDDNIKKIPSRLCEHGCDANRDFKVMEELNKKVNL